MGYDTIAIIHVSTAFESFIELCDMSWQDAVKSITYTGGVYILKRTPPT